MFFKTFSLKQKQIEKKWLLVDANNLVVGRLAAEITKILKGKHKPTYTPHMDCGDNIVVINSDKLSFTGKKKENKIYYRHTGYPGGIKSITPAKMIERSQSPLILRNAVRRMLGNTPLGRKRLSNLYIYPQNQHKHESQKPQNIDIAGFNKKNLGHKHEQR